MILSINTKHKLYSKIMENVDLRIIYTFNKSFGCNLKVKKSTFILFLYQQLILSFKFKSIQTDSACMEWE